MWKAIMATKEGLMAKFGSKELILENFECWRKGKLLQNIYASLRPRGEVVNWSRTIWESWSLPRHSFILWLAVKGKLKTKDRLNFVVTLDDICPLCRQNPESHNHLFFRCTWTADLWVLVKRWLGIPGYISSLQSAARRLSGRKKDVNCKMRRVSLAILVYLIWEERNRRVFEGSQSTVDRIFRRFQSVFFMIFHFHEKDYSILTMKLQ